MGKVKNKEVSIKINQVNKPKFRYNYWKNIIGLSSNLPNQWCTSSNCLSFYLDWVSSWSQTDSFQQLLLYFWDARRVFSSLIERARILPMCIKLQQFYTMDYPESTLLEIRISCEVGEVKNSCTILVNPQLCCLYQCFYKGSFQTCHLVHNNYQNNNWVLDLDTPPHCKM